VNQYVGEKASYNSRVFLPNCLYTSKLIIAFYRSSQNNFRLLQAVHKSG